MKKITFTAHDLWLLPVAAFLTCFGIWVLFGLDLTHDPSGWGWVGLLLSALLCGATHTTVKPLSKRPIWEDSSVLCHLLLIPVAAFAVLFAAVVFGHDLIQDPSGWRWLWLALSGIVCGLLYSHYRQFLPK